MATLTVYRVQRNGNFTVMTNYHLKDRALSLKAKGLFSLLLSLPEGWDFSLPGLAAICKEGMDAIRDAVKELEALGYIIRSRVRNAKGRLENAVYALYERPQSADHASQPVENGQEPRALRREEPVQAQLVEEKPIQENTTLVFPAQGNPPPINNPSYPVTPKINKKIFTLIPIPIHPIHQVLNPLPAMYGLFPSCPRPRTAGKASPSSLPTPRNSFGRRCRRRWAMKRCLRNMAGSKWTKSWASS